MKSSAYKPLMHPLSGQIETSLQNSPMSFTEEGSLNVSEINSTTCLKSGIPVAIYLSEVLSWLPSPQCLSISQSENLPSQHPCELEKRNYPHLINKELRHKGTRLMTAQGHTESLRSVLASFVARVGMHNCHLRGMVSTAHSNGFYCCVINLFNDRLTAKLLLWTLSNRKKALRNMVYLENLLLLATKTLYSS